MTVTDELLQINTELLAYAVDSVVEIEGWACGTLVPDAVFFYKGPTKRELEEQRDPETFWRSQSWLDVELTRAWPQGGLRKVPLEALSEFVNLQPDQNSTAIDFLLKRGVFNEQDLKRMADEDLPAAVAEFGRRTREEGRHCFQTPLAKFWEVRSELASLVNLAKGLEERDRECVVIEVASLQHGHVPSEYPDVFFWGRKAILVFLIRGLESVGLGVREHAGRFYAFAGSPFVRPVLYLMLLHHLGRETPIRECKHDACRRIFFVEGKRIKIYCSPECQNAAKVQRFRQKQRSNGRE